MNYGKIYFKIFSYEIQMMNIFLWKLWNLVINIAIISRFTVNFLGKRTWKPSIFFAFPTHQTNERESVLWHLKLATCLGYFFPPKSQPAPQMCVTHIPSSVYARNYNEKPTRNTSNSSLRICFVHLAHEES